MDYMMETLRDVYDNLNGLTPPKPVDTSSAPTAAERSDENTTLAATATVVMDNKVEQGGDNETANEEENNQKPVGWEVLEQRFAEAVFELGLQQVSPKILKQIMEQRDEQLRNKPELTTERIKSHLQKSRLHFNRSPGSFQREFQLHLRIPSSDEAASDKLTAPWLEPPLVREEEPAWSKSEEKSSLREFDILYDNIRSMHEHLMNYQLNVKASMDAYHNRSTNANPSYQQQQVEMHDEEARPDATTKASGKRRLAEESPETGPGPPKCARAEVLQQQQTQIKQEEGTF